MSTGKDPFELLVVEHEYGDFATLATRAVVAAPASGAATHAATTARFYGFDLTDHPLVTGLAEAPHEVITARSTIPLVTQHIGSEVVVLFDSGDYHRPIVVGVIQEGRRNDSAEVAATPLSFRADGEQFVVSAEREIELRCGEASITLTRAGKVIIKGTYVISRSSGVNKIKGAAVDIN